MSQGAAQNMAAILKWRGKDSSLFCVLLSSHTPRKLKPALLPGNIADNSKTKDEPHKKIMDHTDRKVK